MKYLTLLVMAVALTFLLIGCNINSESATETDASPYSSVTIGDTIQLGEFDWLVLDIQEGNALVISEKILSQRVWHHEQQLLIWEQSDIRQYLNEEFLYNTFTEEERALIVETSVVNNINPWFGSAGAGADTMDRIFLLSVEEVVQYFGDSGLLEELSGRSHAYLSGIVLTDEYNDTRRATAIEDDITSWWWLRTPGRAVTPRLDASAAAVSGGGDLVVYGIYLIAEGGVRPALWLGIEGSK